MDSVNEQIDRIDKRYRSLLAAGLIVSFLLVLIRLVFLRNQAGCLGCPAADLITVAIFFCALFSISQILVAQIKTDRQVVDWAHRQLVLANFLLIVSLALLSQSLIAAVASGAILFVGILATRLLMPNLVSNEPRNVAYEASLKETEAIAGEIHEETLAFEPHCTQQLLRFQTDEGEAVSGQARASFLPGERICALHVGFCPPFSQLPTAEVFQVSGQSVSIKPTAVERFGMRCEIKRFNTSSNEDVVVEFIVASTNESA